MDLNQRVRGMTNKRVAILTDELYEDLELWYPLIRLKEAGCSADVIGTGKKKFTGKHGLSVRPDKNIMDAKIEDYDAVIVPGGYAPDRLRRYPEVLDFVKIAHSDGKVIASICHGPWVLVSAGILKGKTVTCFFAIKDDVKNAGGNYVDKEVVVDGKLITSRHPDDLPAFCREIIKALDLN
jgi:protease I